MDTGAMTTDAPDLCYDSTYLDSVYTSFCAPTLDALEPTCNELNFGCCTSEYDYGSMTESCISVHATVSCDDYGFTTADDRAIVVQVCSSLATGLASILPATLTSVRLTSTTSPKTAVSATATATGSSPLTASLKSAATGSASAHHSSGTGASVLAVSSSKAGTNGTVSSATLKTSSSSGSAKSVSVESTTSAGAGGSKTSSGTASGTSGAVSATKSAGAGRGVSVTGALGLGFLVAVGVLGRF